MKHFSLGSGRVLFVQKKGAVYKIKIYEMGSDNRYVDFTIVRWASFVRAIDEVQNARESPFVCLSGTIWKSLSLNYTPLCPIWLRRYHARTAPTMPTSLGSCDVKKVFRLRSPSDIGKDTCEYEAMITHALNSPSPSRTTVMQWIMTLNHTIVIQYIWRGAIEHDDLNF